MNTGVPLRHRIEAALRPGMTTKNPPDAQVPPTQRPVPRDGLDEVLAAVGVIPAGTRKQRPDGELVSPDHEYQYKSYDTSDHARRLNANR